MIDPTLLIMHILWLFLLLRPSKTVCQDQKGSILNSWPQLNKVDIVSGLDGKNFQSYYQTICQNTIASKISLTFIMFFESTSFRILKLHFGWFFIFCHHLITLDYCALSIFAEVPPRGSKCANARWWRKKGQGHFSNVCTALILEK